MEERPRRTVAQLLVGVLTALALLWLSLGVTADLVLGGEAPAFVRVIWPWGAQTRVQLASQLLEGDPSPSDVVQAVDLAGAALQREPVSATAARVLGLASIRKGRLGAADQWFRHSESLSRRDLPTQLYLIERAVGSGDIPEALVHYDRALRTSKTAPSLLIPVLRQAIEDPTVAAALGDLLVARPAWGISFLREAAPKMLDARALEALLRHARLDVRNPEQRDLAEIGLRQLVSLQALAPAVRLYEDLQRRRGAYRPALLRNGDFDSTTEIEPFDWGLLDDPDLGAIREQRDDGKGNWLVVHASGGRGGVVANQFLTLPPGAYALEGLGQSATADRSSQPSVNIRCTTGSWSMSVSLRPSGSALVPFDLTFEIPAGCPAQFIEIAASATSDTDAHIDALRIRRR